MKHASGPALEALAPLLAELRAMPGLVERKPGIFYFRSAAFLHFHEDAAGLFADAKLAGNSFDRFVVNSEAERAALLDRVRGVVVVPRPHPF